MSENQHITNGDDPVKPLAWVKREDGVPELNTEQKGLTKREYFASQNQDEISQSDAIIIMGHKPPEQNTLDYFIWKSEAQARANVIHSNSLINALNENLVEDVSQKKEQQIGLIAGHVDDISYEEFSTISGLDMAILGYKGKGDPRILLNQFAEKKYKYYNRYTDMRTPYVLILVRHNNHNFNV